MRLNLSDLKNGAVGGTELEETGVERKLEGKWRCKED